MGTSSFPTFLFTSCTCHNWMATALVSGLGFPSHLTTPWWLCRSVCTKLHLVRGYLFPNVLDLSSLENEQKMQCLRYDLPFQCLLLSLNHTDIMGHWSISFWNIPSMPAAFWRWESKREIGSTYWKGGVCVCVSVFCLMIFLVSLFPLANESLIDCRELVTPVSRWTQFPILIPPYLTYGDYTLDIRTGPKQGSLQNPTPPALTLRFCDFHLGGSPWGLSPPELWRKYCRNSETKILNF